MSQDPWNSIKAILSAETFRSETSSGIFQLIAQRRMKVEVDRFHKVKYLKNVFA
jgi:hypothetical protein